MKALCLLLTSFFFAVSSPAQIPVAKPTRAFDIPPKWSSKAADLIGGAAADEDDPAYRASNSPTSADSPNADPLLGMQHNESAKRENEIQWIPAMSQALLSTGVMHTFNLWTEAGTRDALYGPWFQDYIHSVSELRGWSDSDRFMAPYVGHTIQGSSYGFILRQNDPKYRTVQWGDGRDYFISVLRSMAFAAVWHTQWKIGPASEASIGNVMLHASPGFITLVNTPTIGTLSLMAEDIADRYLIIGLENRTSNRAVIILARGFLNPGRSFANVLAFKRPWNRDTRMGLFGKSYQIRKQAVAAYKNGSGEKLFEFVPRKPVRNESEHPKEAPIELAAYPYFEHYWGGRNCIGGGGSGAARLSPTVQFVAEINGCLMMGLPTYTESGDSLFYGGGLRWTPQAAHRWSPHGEFLFGGTKLTYEVDDPALKQSLLAQWNDGNGTLPHYPKRSDWSTEVATNGPSIAVGGGLDWVVNRAFTLRLANLQFTHSWIGDAGLIHAQSGIRFTTEAVLRIGTW